MAEVIRMPRLSDTMAEGKIVSWNKKVGDKVKAGDVLAEVETDKATMELESYNEGTLLYIGVEAGSAAKVDGVLAVVGKAGEDYKAALDAAGNGSKTATAEKSPQSEKPANVTEPTGNEPTKNEPTSNEPTSNEPTRNEKRETVSLPAGAKEIRMPLLSDTMTEGKIVSWNKKVGDAVKADDVLADVETDKATMEVVGYEEGTLLYIGVEAGKAAKINQIIAIVGKPGTDVAAYVAAEKSAANTNSAGQAQSPKQEESKNEQQTTSNEKQETGNTDRIKASPLAKKLAEEKGIDLAKINGSGDNGRVTKKDVDSYQPTTASSQAADSAPVGSSAKPAPALVAFANTGQEGHTDIPLTQMRSVIARRLGESMFSAPHFYLTIELNMDNAITARNAMNDVSPVKISFNDLLIKACAMSLRLHPAVNSSWMGDFIRQNHHIHIGSALALPEGLIVPVIKFADQKTLSQIAADAKQLYQKAKDKKLQPVEFSGNTFTISNLGMMDIEDFTAIINPPDSCILAVGKIKEVVIRKGTSFDVTNVMKVTLSCDHRSVDGAVGAAFLQTLKKFMENPVTMLV
ncbi:MAG: pyruvate dehydrogenase complex dihydrolipoamide acetyltransferase [Ferruginibacter sp.]